MRSVRPLAPGLLVITGHGLRQVRCRRPSASLPFATLPDHLVAVRRHHVEDFELFLHDLVVRLAVGEPELRAAAVDRVAVGDAVALVPVERLVLHRGAELRRSCRVRRGDSAGAGGKRAVVDDLARACGCRPR